MEQVLGTQLEPLLAPPNGIDGPADPLEWLEPTLLKKSLYFFAATQFQSRDQQQIVYAEKFYKQTKKLYEDKFTDPGYQTRKLAAFVSDMGLKVDGIYENIQRLNGMLFLSSTGADLGYEQAPDLGSEALNQLMTAITRVSNELRAFREETMGEMNGLRAEMNGLRTEMNGLRTEMGEFKAEMGEFKAEMGEFKAEMGEFKAETGEFKAEMGEFKAEMGEFKAEMGEFKSETNGRLANIEVMSKNSVARFENQFKGRGGHRNSLEAYHSISNIENKIPEELGLPPLTSLAQIQQLSRGLESYLNFYKMLTSGLLEDKRERLIRYIGINVESERSYGRKI
ncbi:uncharacterized protein PRCAT00006315001 [Priceomyces carsonii]|uniref:uncharacterized protein n=1 Tax=Priceomyces carsonii TaxID=28549 RepID=UPI002EDAEA90|nr:unnamed protein product [Priceomyces carsonii]